MLMKFHVSKRAMKVDFKKKTCDSIVSINIYSKKLNPEYLG